MTIRILHYGFRIEEVQLPFKKRLEGSESELCTFHNGFRILIEIARISKAYKPLIFFGLVGLALIFGGGVCVIWGTLDYLEGEYVNKVPTEILATGRMLLVFGSIRIGILLNTISYSFRENM